MKGCRSYKFLAVTGLALAISGCGDGGGGAVCHSIAASNPTVTSNVGTCVNCSANNLPAAADQDFGSFSTMNVVGSASTSIRATAQSGIAFPAGQTVGVFWSNQSGSTYSLTLNTYLGGVLQESFAVCGVCGTNNPGPAHFDSAGSQTSQPFDAVEVMLTGSQSNAQPAVFEINEICDN